MEQVNEYASREWSPKLIWRAGLVPFFINEDGTIEMLFMIPSDQRYGGSDPQMAKGRIDDDEEPEQTALREAKEELGLIQGNILGSLEYFGVHLGRTHVYACEVKSKDRFGIFSGETEDTRWMTEGDFRKNGRDIHRDIVVMVGDFAEQVRAKKAAADDV